MITSEELNKLADDIEGSIAISPSHVRDLARKVRVLESFRIEIKEDISKPTECRVWRDGRLIFAGRSLA